MKSSRRSEAIPTSRATPATADRAVTNIRDVLGADAESSPLLAMALAMAGYSRVILADNLLRGAAMSLIPLLAALDRLALWHVYAVAAVYGLLMMVSLAGGPALIPTLTATPSVSPATTAGAASTAASVRLRSSDPSKVATSTSASPSLGRPPCSRSRRCAAARCRLATKRPA